jgi:hypothetical protein
MLHRFENVALARQYIESQCRGWRALSTLMLDELDSFHDFYTFTPAPPDVIDLENGAIKAPGEKVPIPGGFAVPIEDDVSLFAQWIYAELQSPGTIVLLEDPLSRPTDPIVRKAAHPVLDYEDTVLHAIPEAADKERIVDVVRKSNLLFGHAIGIVTTSPAAADLRALMQAARWIMISAYNRETFLIGERISAKFPR